MRNFGNRNYKNSKHQLLQKRDQRFNRNRKINQKMENQTTQQIVQNIIDVDYCKFYPENVQKQIDASLKMPVTELNQKLPPLDRSTISLYRRSGKSVYQCRLLGSKQFDAHMTYESLLMLAHTQSQKFGNYQALVKQFQRDFKWFLKIESKDIRQMAIVAAGNKILGKQQDILQLVQNNIQFLWVLINHTYENKISCRYMLPFLLDKNQLAFKTFSQLTCNLHDQSILLLAQSDQAIDCLVSAMHEPGDLCKYAIKIIGNILGQGQGHWKLFYYSKLLDISLNLLTKVNDSLKISLIEMICSFVCQNGGATAVLRHPTLMPCLLDMLDHFAGLSEKLRRELLNTFSFIVYKAQQTEVFTILMKNQLFMICSDLLGTDTNLDLNTLQLICGLVELGEKYPNQNDQNIASILINSSSNLAQKINLKCQSQNNYISGLAITIKQKMTDMDQQL